MTPLRRQMIEDVTVRGFSEATHASYLHAVTELARFHRSFPAAKAVAGITKTGGLHSLRHAFATHMLDSSPHAALPPLSRS
jgi:integrase